MFLDRPLQLLKQYRYPISIVVLIELLLAKFYAPLFLFDVPLGYDPGIYRYLFVQYSDFWPPFTRPDLLPWTKEHPMGLFFFSSILMKGGVPVDWLIGWIWNTVPIVVALTLSTIFWKREGGAVGVVTLLIFLLSQPYYDGFSAMYYKVYAALFFLILTYYFFEKKSQWFVLPAILTIITHHQTGLILILAFGTWWLLTLPSSWRDPSWRNWTAACVFIGVVALVWYIPIYERALLGPLKSVLTMQGSEAPPGVFPDPMFYVRTMAFLLALGLWGWVSTLRKNGLSIWHVSVIWCAIFVVFKLVFYRRFFLQLDFFLIPFTAIALVGFWKRAKSFLPHIFLVSFLFAQTVISWNMMLIREPEIHRDTLTTFQRLGAIIPLEADVYVLENRTTLWLRGWLPYHQVYGPGLLDEPNSYEMWEKFIFGTNEDRKAISEQLFRPIYIVLTDEFYSYYGEYAQNIVEDPCFKKVGDLPLLLTVCTTFD